MTGSRVMTGGAVGAAGPAETATEGSTRDAELYWARDSRRGSAF